MGELLVRFIKNNIHIVCFLFAKVIQWLQERGTFTTNRADCGAPRWRCTPTLKRTHCIALKRPHQKVSEPLHIIPSERFCMSSIPRGYTQWVQPNLHSMLISVCGSYTLYGREKFPRQMLFTNECRFTRDTVFNSQNIHIWDDKNSHAQHAHGVQQHFTINVWAGIVNCSLIGPYLLPSRLTGHAYLIFLQEVLGKLLEDVSLDVRRCLWFQHDMVYHPIMQVQFVITLTDVLYRDG